ncbi:MAG: hypothetical protein ACRESS_07420 [Stenotrophobium sp.]
MSAGLDWRSLREIDLASSRPKGSAFRAFKRLRSDFAESRDYVVLHHQDDAQAIGALHAAGRIYRGSINVVLLAPAAAQRVLDALNGAVAAPAPRRQ